MLRALLFGIAISLIGCGARPSAPPAPAAPTGVLFELQIVDLGETLARLNQTAERLGIALDLRAPLKARLSELSSSARLDGPWWLVGFQVEGEPGLALVMHGAPGDDEPDWRAQPLGRWETAIRRLGPAQLVATDHPAWIDEHAAWIRALQPRTGPDLQLEIPVARSLSAQPFDGADDVDLLPAQQALLDDAWDVIGQIDTLSLTMDLAAERVVIGLAARPQPKSALAAAVAQLEPLPTSAWARVPKDRLGALGCRLPSAAWTGFDRVLRAAGGEALPGPTDLRARAFAALGGDVVLTLGGTTPSVLAWLEPRSRKALDDLLAAVTPRPAFEIAGVAVSRIDPPDGQPIHLARVAGGLLAAAGPDTRTALSHLIDGTTAAGPRADADLADALRRTAGASCVAVIDADSTAAALGARPSGAPPAHVALGAVDRTVQVTLDLPLAQIQQLFGLWMRRALPVPQLDRRDI